MDFAYNLYHCSSIPFYYIGTRLFFCSSPDSVLFKWQMILFSFTGPQLYFITLAPGSFFCSDPLILCHFINLWLNLITFASDTVFLHWQQLHFVLFCVLMAFSFTGVSFRFITLPPTSFLNVLTLDAIFFQWILFSYYGTSFINYCSCDWLEYFSLATVSIGYIGTRFNSYCSCPCYQFLAVDSDEILFIGTSFTY